MKELLTFKLVSSKMMKGVITKIVEKKICEKIGCKIDIQLNNIQIDVVDGEVKAHLDADAKMEKTEFDKLMNNLVED